MLRSRLLSWVRGKRTTAKGCVLDCPQPRQDGPNARTKLVVELPAIRGQGLEAWIRYASIGRSSLSSLLEGGWTSTVTRDTQFMSQVNDWAGGDGAVGIKRWVGRMVCLSCDSCLL